MSKRLDMKSVACMGIGLILAIGVLHLLYAPEEFEEVTYMGLLFVLNFLGAVVAAYAIARGWLWGWQLGLLVAAGSIVGYVVSRTSGMPGHEVEAWLLPGGVAALSLEAIFTLLVFVAWPRLLPVAPQASGAYAPRLRNRLSRLLPAATVVGLVVFGAVGSFWLSRIIPITADALDAQLGLRVTRITTTMLGGIVDVRVLVSDPEKADEIFNDHDKMPYIRIDNSDIVLLPPDHAHKQSLLPGRTYAMLFPNTANVIRPGAAISIYFGNQRLDPITVQ